MFSSQWSYIIQNISTEFNNKLAHGLSHCIKGGRMGRSDTVSLWYVSLLINTRFRFFILE